MEAPRGMSTSSRPVARSASNGGRTGFTRPVGPNLCWKELPTSKTTWAGRTFSGPPKQSNKRVLGPTERIVFRVFDEAGANGVIQHISNRVFSRLFRSQYPIDHPLLRDLH